MFWRHDILGWNEKEILTFGEVIRSLGMDAIEFLHAALLSVNESLNNQKYGQCVSVSTKLSSIYWMKIWLLISSFV